MPSKLISIYCFFKNEEALFPVTVPTWLPFADELVLVDTGSTDGSLAWARGLSAAPPDGVKVRVEQLPWPDPMNWALITKQTMDLCSLPWRLRIDADEKLAGDPRALRSVLNNFEKLVKLQERADFAYQAVRHGCFEEPQYRPVAVGGLLLALSEPETGYTCWRSRLHRADWGWRYRIDPAPVPPEGQEGGVFLLLQNWICNTIHTRASIRPEALARAEGVLELAERLDGPLDPQTRAHYVEAVERARKYGQKGTEGQ
jgi:glycosyltransferase involved in cell wall biosynthesis